MSPSFIFSAEVPSRRALSLLSRYKNLQCSGVSMWYGGTLRVVAQSVCRAKVSWFAGGPRFFGRSLKTWILYHTTRLWQIFLKNVFLWECRDSRSSASVIVKRVTLTRCLIRSWDWYEPSLIYRNNPQLFYRKSDQLVSQINTEFPHCSGQMCHLVS